MKYKMRILQGLKLAAVLAVALSMGACANKNLTGADGAMASAATPGSQQDFVVNVGDRVFFHNFELRFPLVRDLNFPFGGGFRDIRGVFFFDIGGAYFRGGEWLDSVDNVFVAKVPEGDDRCSETGFIDDFQRCREGWNFWDSREDRLANGVASFGVGVNFRLGILELNWVFAKRTDLSGTRGPWKSAFYIGNKF